MANFEQYNVVPYLSPVRVVATSNVSGTYNNGPTNSGVGATLTVAASSLTVDSVVLAVGDRVLLSAQTAANQNGIYVVLSIGSTVVLQRAADMQCQEQLHAGFYVGVAAGTTLAGAFFALIEPLPAKLGVDNLVLSQAVSGGGLGTMSLQNANAVAITGGSVTGITDLAVADGGSGASTGAAALTNFGVKRATTAAYAGGGTSNAFTATGLAATDIVVATILASTNAVSICKAVPTTDTLTVTFSADPGAATTVQWHALPA